MNRDRTSKSRHADGMAQRYRRQVSLPEIGEKGQARLASSVVLVCGCGALGGVIVELLARAGIGEMVLVDRDIVDPTNLQRQMLFTERDARRAALKVEAARERVHQINSAVHVHAIAADLDGLNAEQCALETAFRPVDLILDGLDNFATRMVLNDLSVKHGIPLIYGGAVSTCGTVHAVLPKGDYPWGAHGTQCLRCLFGTLPPPGMSPSCDTAGVLGPLVSIVGAMQVAEAIKVLVGDWSSITPVARVVDCWYGLNTTMVPRHDHGSCACCDDHRFDYLGHGENSRSRWLCGNDAIQISPSPGSTVPDLQWMAESMAPERRPVISELVLRCRWPAGTTDAEVTLFRDGRAIIRGVGSLPEAQRVYEQLLGL